MAGAIIAWALLSRPSEDGLILLAVPILCAMGAVAARYLLRGRTNKRLMQLDKAMRQAATGRVFSLPIEGDDAIASIARSLDGFIRAHDEAQKALQASERRLRDVADAASEWIWETDEENRFTYISEPPTRDSDIDTRQLIGKRRLEVAEFDIEDAEIWHHHEDDLRARRPFRDFRFCIRGNRGDRHYLRSSGKPIFAEDGEFLGYRGISMEITPEVEAAKRTSESRRLMMEALREARDAAERANHSKTRFLAAASHDLRQPLQALGLFVATLSQRALSDDLRPIVAKIEGSLEALEHLLDTLLDISRLDAGVVEAHSVSFPLQDLFDRLALEFEPLAEAKGLTARFVRTSATLRSDPALLERILRNLLSNAIRYTSRGGIVVGARRRGDILHIQVADTGRGIPANQQREIFREFHQLPNGGPDRRQGLGLGLAIVDRLATLLGHHISVKSEPGRGSVFCVEAPLAVPSSQRVPQPALPNDPLAGRLIVVVDDDSIVRDGLHTLLEIWGCRVLMAEGPEDAIDAVEKLDRIPDAIIADYRLKGRITGADVVDHLRALCDADIPAVLVTGDTSPNRLRQAANYNLKLLHKPVRPDRLRAALLDAMDEDAKETETIGSS